LRWTSHPVAKLHGCIPAPGDKSCSHRAILFAGLAEGTSEITGLLESDDVLRTRDAVEAIGAHCDRLGPGHWRVTGIGRREATAPLKPLDLGNSGTGVRLMMGVVAGLGLTAEFVGDESLSRRPMGRVLDPLTEMGAVSHSTEGRLPVCLEAAKLKGIRYKPPHASAQVKSAVLLAGLNAEGTTTVIEPRPTRDHTERMLRGFGAELGQASEDGATAISIKGGQVLKACDLSVPGDPSSAAFATVAALISRDAEVLVEGLLSNETRDGLYVQLSAMGAELGAEERGDAAGERVIDLTAAASTLKGRSVPERLVAAMIDEFPIFGVAAAFAEGRTVVSGAKELRVKESDRIAATVALLRANGVSAEETPEGFTVEGMGRDVPGGGLVNTHHDHRIAMAALVMGTAARAPVSVDDISMIATSYPEFLEHMKAIGADIREG
jgi:3-phosphoshikimate 1-carboxyvinyltransferase